MASRCRCSHRSSSRTSATSKPKWPNAPSVGTRTNATGALHERRDGVTRARLFGLDPARRLTIRTLWRECPDPADPSYLGDLLHQIAIGRIDPRSAAVDLSAKDPPQDHAQPGDVRAGLPQGRPAQDRRRLQDQRGRRVHLVRQSRIRPSDPDLARASQRAARKFHHVVGASAARVPCRPVRSLGRDHRSG